MSLEEQKRMRIAQLQIVRHDRQTLPVPMEHDTRPSGKMLAFVLGRLVNELRFHLQTAWLDCIPDSPRQAGIWCRISDLLVDTATTDDDRRDFELTMNATRNNWLFAIGSEWRTDRIQSLLDKLNSKLPDTQGDKLVWILEEASHMQSYVIPVLKLSERALCESIVFFDLGHQLDQWIHPPFERFAIQLCEEDSEDMNSSWESASPTPSNITRNQLQRLIPLPIDSWLTDEWLKSVNQILRIVGFANSDLTSIERADLSGMFDQITSFVEELDRNGVPDIDRLGLTIDENNQRVSRTGFLAPATLKARELKLLKHFLNQDRQPTPLEWLESNWPSFGRKKRPSENTVAAAIGALNEAIEQLGIEVREGTQGRILQEICDQLPSE